MKLRALSTAILKPNALSIAELEKKGRERELVVFPMDSIIEVGAYSRRIAFVNLDSSQGIESDHLFVRLSSVAGGRDRGFFDAKCVQVLVD